MQAICIYIVYLVLLGISCFSFNAGHQHVWRPMMSQSRKMSMVESIANVLIGYGVAVATQTVVFPLFNLHAEVKDQLLIGLIFTVVSLLRSYFLRRLFNRI